MEGLMTAQVKRLPSLPERTPEQHARFVKDCDLSERLAALSRKAALLSFGITGLMELHGNEQAWGLRDAADELDGELAAIARELTN
jgi:hypothetical protein